MGSLKIMQKKSEDLQESPGKVNPVCVSVKSVWTLVDLLGQNEMGVSLFDLLR